ncbi:uncharacterized protein LOC128711098 [Anopheles marshallii]|uniref:uncharacterized protein LOC128711098 n=1 Tax=Anopheles marshallii TaxID=1521116 RepID=UPI00237C4EF3|nr:uncharacterized protein LOC128711098 [Anopheles marshallii]
MSSHDKRTPWKSHRSEFSGRDSPERNRNRMSDSPTGYRSYKDRRYYNNRTPYTGLHSAYHSRYRYEKKPDASDEKEQHVGEKSEVPTSTESDVGKGTSKSAWSSSSTVLPTTKRHPWIRQPPPLVTAPYSSSAYSEQSNFSIIFQHINSVCNQNDQSQLERPMSFIDRLIADEAMRMLSAASSSEATSLNTPCEASEAVASNVPASDATETSKQEEENNTIYNKIGDKVATVSAANSALLQKSAEQVTEKLLSQLSTMSKYDLKHMIDNPAGKYETALNRHAQSKLRAEVRKQLKNFGLGKLGSAFVTDDGTVESDEAIDANKIPPALLEQIGHALDVDLFDLSQTESIESNEQLPAAVENPTFNSNEPEAKDEHEQHALMCTPSTEHSSSASNVKQNIANVSGSPGKMSTKNTNTLKSPPLKPGHLKKIMLRKSSNTKVGNSAVVRDPVASTLQSKVSKPLPKKKTFVLLSKNAGEENIASDLVQTKVSDLVKTTAAVPFEITSVPSLKDVSQIGQSAKEDTNIILKVSSSNNADPIPGDANSSVKNVSLLRVSTVEELNRRLDEQPSMQNLGSQRVPEVDPTNVVPERGLLQENIPNANERLATMIPIHNTNDAGIRLFTQELLLSSENSKVNAADPRWQSTQNCNNNAHRSQSPALLTVQYQEQPNCSNVQPKKQTEPVCNTNPINRTTNVLRVEKSSNPVVEPVGKNRNNGKRGRTSIDQAAEIGIGTLVHNTMPTVFEDQPTVQGTQPLLSVLSPPVPLPAKIGKKTKKRKRPKQNDRLPSTVCASVPSHDTKASTTTEVQNMEQGFGADETNNDQTNDPSAVVKLRKKKKKRKVSRFEPANNIENASNVPVVPPAGTVERIPSLHSTEEKPNDDHILNNAYDQYLNKDLTNPAPEIVEPQTHITIAKVCSISGSEEMSSSTSAITVSATNEDTTKNTPDIQLPMEISLTELKEETIATPQTLEESVQNGAPSDNYSDGNLTDWNLPTESNAESKEGIERIVSPQPLTTDIPAEEYILGDDPGEKSISRQTLPDVGVNHPKEQSPHVANHSTTPFPADCADRLKSLCEITEGMVQNLETQTMELYSRKMQIDTQIMQLQGERMDIDQQLERLQYMRNEQIKFIRLNLLELLSSNSSSESIMPAPSPVTSDTGTGLNGIPVSQSVPSGQTQIGVRQQERKIRRITPIGGNSVLMQIFKRRRAPSSDRATEENPEVDHV